jgi:hypothetical protein
MRTHQKSLWVLPLIMGSCALSYGQEPLPVTPPLTEARHAITLDLAGSTPFIGLSYHNQIVQFGRSPGSYKGAIELNAGFGFIPSICVFGCSESSLSTHHSLLLLWGRKLQGEIGYAGFLTGEGIVYSGKTYLPGVNLGLRYAPKAWLFRLYMVGVVHKEKGTAYTGTNDLVWETKTLLLPIPGFSVGRRF